MKYILLIVLLTLTACQNLRHKTFRLVASGTGGKITLVDPTGGGSPMPQIVIGAFQSSITTIPVGVDVEYTAETYELFSGRLLFKETMKVTAVNGRLSVTDDGVEVFTGTYTVVDNKLNVIEDEKTND